MGNQFACDCEYGGDCSHVSVCTMNNEIEDRDDRIKELEKELEIQDQANEILTRKLKELEAENERKLDACERWERSAGTKTDPVEAKLQRVLERNAGTKSDQDETD